MTAGTTDTPTDTPTSTPTDTQLGFEGMPRRLFSCTPSRLATWEDCPRRYRMTYLDRPAPPRGPAWAHNSVGASVHNALAAWWRLPRERRTVEAAGDLLDRGWLTDGFRDPEQSLAWRVRARRLVEAYVEQLDPDDEPAGVERVVSTRTESLALSGRVDRIDRRGDVAVIVDYKTGRRPLTDDDARASMALAVYAVATERTLRIPCRRVELHHLPTGDVLAHEHTEESLARQLRRATSIAADAAAADERWRAGLAEDEVDAVFPPRPGPQCGWCDYARSCAEGRKAAPTHASWDGLAE